ncbi:MAG TPA: threonine--tRNA ligase [Solirubrobacteraceae bacterium]|nr:threonine--tRNA ligase [Solirubrobacteraceae bacterium]
MITVTLPDGNALQLPDGASGADAAAAIGPGLARAALAIEVSTPEGGDGDPAPGAQLRDLSRPLPDGAHIAILTKKDGPKALELIRHDAAHVLAAAVMELYDGVKISIGPPIEDGFYYDFEFPAGVSVSEADFPAIEERMRAHVKADERFEREDVPVAQARERFLAARQDYKVELIDDLVRAASHARAGAGGELETVSLYTNGPFTDLCRGPHAPSTKAIGAFKLSSVAGAYWRGDSTRTMLTRIYGTAFFAKAELEQHLQRLEQARARDHRKLGRELGLFAFSEVSPGAAFWLPAGTTVFNELVTVSRRMGRERGYTEVKTPQIFDSELWKTSGHWGKFRENMFTLEIEGREMGVKPMNCPGHLHLFGLQRHSYRDLPVRYSEPGLLHRNEASGVLHGLLRVRHFAQDDAHIFCTEEQVQAELAGCLEMLFDTYAMFDFEVRLELSTRPDVRSGSDEMWDHAEDQLAKALAAKELEYELNPGDGAFYGPKIDIHITDSLGRSWQLGTVQIDYSMPERFGLSYTGADNAEHRPVMIHRALFGSYERFIGIMLEHYAGELPLWLAPTQAIVLPVSDRFNAYAEQVRDELLEREARVEIDARGESIARKIRDAELRKIPYMLVVGEREQGERAVSVRSRAPAGEQRAARGGADEGSVALRQFADRLSGELYSPALKPAKSSRRHA